MENLRYLKTSEETQLASHIQELRHYLHQHPELSLQEFMTQKFIMAQLESYGFEEIYSVGGTGVVAVLRGDLDESILLRADIDALPLDEKVALPYASKVPGVMHACGHDAHTAILLGAAQIIIRRVKEGLRLRRGLKFCFQPGEENTHNGAGRMIQDKEIHDILDGCPRVQYCFGLHITSEVPVGHVLYDIGPVTANSDKWKISIQGKGGHASQPENTIDAVQVGVNVASQIYQLRGKVLKQTVPSAVSIGELKGGYAPNIISDTCYITGSVRTTSDEDRDNILEHIQDIAKYHGVMYKCGIQFEHGCGNKKVNNHPILEQFMTSAISRVAKFNKGGFGLAGEDFWNFAELRPSAYFVVGASLPGSSKDFESRYPHHSPVFQLDESGFIYGTKSWLSIIQNWQDLLF